MNKTFIRVMCGGAEALAPRETSNKRSPARLAALLFLLCATLSISGCIGLTGASKPASSTSAPSAAAISVAPASVNFGSVAVGGTVSQSVTVSNPGGSALTVTQASTTASGFSITGATLPMTVAAGKQSTFTIVFAPKATGAVSGSVSVMSNASSTPSTVSVNGTGVAAAALLNSSAATLNFGNITAGASGAQSVTLTNAGNSNVTISGVSVSGAKFSASGVSSGLILSPGQHAVLNVTFSPSAVGALSGSVTVASNASNSPATVSLSGAGVAAAVPHSVSLAWTADTTSVAGYNVHRSIVSGGPYTKLNATPVTSAAYTDSTVSGGLTYFYVVTAVSSAGAESLDSTQVSAVIPTP
ncbi:MAG: choice-of-anchor D domain-containing protein [Acidobacteriia bacterium]|nr:choice-of-anchor D domain-containing protein [Terriglobia bacterium]